MSRRMDSRGELKDGLLHLFPGGRSRIDQVEVIRSGNLHQVHVFARSRRVLLLGRHIVPAEGRWDDVICRTVDEPLPCMGQRKLHGIRFVIMVGYFRGGAAQKLDHGVVAQMKLESALQVDDTRQRHDARYVPLVRRQAERKLGTGRVSHRDNPGGIEMVFCSVLYEKLIGRSDVGKRSGPGSAFIAHPAIFQIGGRHPAGCECRTKMSGMIEVVLGAPEAAVNIDHERVGPVGLILGRRQTQIEKLVGIGAVRETGIRRRWRQVQNVFRHLRFFPESLYSYRSASMGSRLAARIAGTIPLMIPTTPRMLVATSRIIGETIRRMSAASACFAKAL